MAGEEAISYTDMDIEEAFDDFCNRFIDEISLSKTITYATRQRGFEKSYRTSKKLRFGHLTRKGKLTGSKGITDLPNDFLGTRLRGSSFFER